MVRSRAKATEFSFLVYLAFHFIPKIVFHIPRKTFAGQTNVISEGLSVGTGEASLYTYKNNVNSVE